MVTLLSVAHLGLSGLWLGAMVYSLLVVQPRVARFLAADDDQLEEFLTVLGAGNRRPVLAIVAGLVVTGGALAVVLDPDAAEVVLLTAEAALLAAATVVFAQVSWRLWPRRVFALATERPAHRAALHRHALTMLALVAGVFTLAVVVLTIE